MTLGPRLSLGVEDGGWAGQHAQRLSPGASGARGSLEGAVEAPALGSQLSAAATLPVAGGASLQKESGISSPPCSPPGPAK